MIKVTSDAANKLIKKLEQEKGILTEKEFQEKKKQLLSQL